MLGNMISANQSRLTRRTSVSFALECERRDQDLPSLELTFRVALRDTRFALVIQERGGFQMDPLGRQPSLYRLSAIDTRQGSSLS